METKVCSKCQEEKTFDQFYRVKQNGNLRQAQCIDCWKTMPSQTPQAQLERTYKTRRRNLDFVWEYLKNHPCIDCGESDPVVLHFDHRPDEKKFTEVSKLVHNTMGLKRIQEEIDKCDVRCANCHTRRTAMTQGWRKTGFAV